ncbi:hypothetical protein GJ496_003089 [Pomphorhynchus laevis]|nr:hypothetical protein GJ496_003089 [Pomphorhynchus laevis]
MTLAHVTGAITLEAMSHRLLYKLEDTNFLTSEQQLTTELAARVFGLLLNSKNVYDNTMVYIIVYLYWQLGIAEYLTVDNAPVVEIVHTAEGVILYRKLRADAAEPMYQAVADDLSNLTFVLFSENLDDGDFLVLAGMAAGLPRLKVHGDYMHQIPAGD